MSSVTPARAVLFAACAACVVYAGACRNGWAFDDEPIVKENAAAHSPRAAAGAFFSPYWPVSQTTSGQYRPLTILSFGVDWALFDGRPEAFHAVNVLLHAMASGLLVMVALRWLAPAGALVCGFVFAVHPVHVEAVANVVGRAEVLVAVALLAMVLAARRYRRARAPGARRAWLSATGLALLAGLLSKEHAVIGVALLVLDEALSPERDWRRSTNLYVVVVGVTVGWLYLWMAIAGSFVSVAVAAPVRGLSFVERLATVVPVQLEVLRLLVWPFDLSSDYNPLMVPQRLEWSTVATVGAVTAGAVLALGIASARRAPAVAFGVLAAAVSYAPTSNIVFGSGVFLSERNLYLAAAAPALVAGWLVLVPRRRRAFAAGLAVASVAFAIRTVTRVPVWRDSETVLIEDAVDHPDNYRSRLRVGSFLRAHGDLPGALAEATAASAIFPNDPWISLYSVVRALDLGLPGTALAEAQRAHRLEPDHPSFARLVVRARLAQGMPDSALPVARRSVLAAPLSPLAADSYVEVLDSLRAAPWQRWLAVAELEWRRQAPGAASTAVHRGLDGLAAAAVEPWQCWDVITSRSLVHALRSADAHWADSVVGSQACRDAVAATPGGPA